MAITLTAVLPPEVGFDGGHLITLQGSFVVGTAYNVHIGLTGGTADTKALSGQPGEAHDIVARSATVLQCYTPPLESGGPYLVYVVDPISLDDAVLGGALTFRVANHHMQVFKLRAYFPIKIYRVGPHNFEQVV